MKLEAGALRHASLTQKCSIAGETGLELISTPDGETEAGQHTVKHVWNSGHRQRGAKNKHVISSARHTSVPHCCRGCRQAGHIAVSL